MVWTENYQCEVCGKVTRIKIQLGWLEVYPIQIKCGECHISIYGKVELDPLGQSGVRIELNNVKKIKSDKSPDFLIEVSGELLTEKLRPVQDDISIYIGISPFLKSIGRMGNENREQFQQDIVNLSVGLKDRVSVLRRINDLWINGNYKYLKKEIHKVFDKQEYPADNELEYLRAIHQLNIQLFMPINRESFSESKNYAINMLKDVYSKNRVAYKEMLLEFKLKLTIYEERIYLIICNFIEKIPMFLPMLGFESYEENYKNEAIKDLGLTTVNFESIKDFYIETFEDIIDIFELVIAYENFFVRNNFNTMDEEINNQIKSLNDFQTKMNNKGKKVEFINKLKRMKWVLKSEIDNKLRNAIGHRSYKYDVLSQKITYYSSGVVDKGISEEIYLTEFVIKCLDLFRTTLNLEELVYQTRKQLLILEGAKVRSLDDYYGVNKNDKHRSEENRKKVKYQKNRKKAKQQRTSRKINRKSK